MLPDRIPAQRNEDGRAAEFPSLTLPVASGRPREQPLALKHTRRHAQVIPGALLRKAQYRRIGGMSLPGAVSPSTPERSVSRDSMEDYWSEMKNIQEDCQERHEELAERASVDEAELEEAWLQEAGLSTLVTGTQSDGPAEALLSTLTRSQAAMVKKRLDNYTQTLRKRNRQPMRHVRDVFSMPDASSELTPPISPNGQIAPKLPQWNPPKVSPPCAVFTPADSNGSSSGSETIVLSLDVPYSEGARAHRKGRECQDCRRIRKDDRDLPSFQIVKPRQGVTRVNDLSSEDIRKIGYISLIELTTFYDTLGIEMKRNRVVRSRARDSGIFGVPLATLLENDQKKYPGSRVPLVFRKVRGSSFPLGLLETRLKHRNVVMEIVSGKFPVSTSRGSDTRPSRILGQIRGSLSRFILTCRPTLVSLFQKTKAVARSALLLSKLEQTGLQTEGILRVPGSASRVKHLRQELELKFYEDRFDWDQVRQNDAAGLLKMFIRELPYPLLTQQHLPAFTAAHCISSPKHQIQALHLLIMLLPEANRDTLKALLEFLRKVVAYEDKNRMSLWNVSMIVAPNLFTFRGKNAKQEEMQGAVAAAQLVRLLITHQDLLWTVPCFLISHVRKMNEAAMGKKTPTSEKSKRRLLKRWNLEKDRDRSEVTDLREGVIRVHAPLQAKVSMAIQLNGEMKARDIMARFDIENGRALPGSRRTFNGRLPREPSLRMGLKVTADLRPAGHTCVYCRDRQLLTEVRGQTLTLTFVARFNAGR
ncbi:Rho GTPase-activating protein 18 [Anabarilius grahami]|uniref:Rho GTPase-activating protein 18 n=1 Tax=Anabarilius grahami TaxID=495550 RepID=A0A3N0YI06_ANAGA|nr:Rho GTPase-activating protein 18 [Anabarilius grahami]